MARFQTIAKPATPLRNPIANGPGSNGYFQRDIYREQGTFTWIAKKTGNILIQALGTGSGACASRCGGSGGFGEKLLSVTVGDTLTLVVGPGGNGSALDSVSSAGGTTSISGTPVGGTPLVLTGATGVNTSGSVSGTAGNATGPWDMTNPGAVPVSNSRGSCSSGSPFGPGFACTGAGGAGWGGGASNSGGASSHMPCFGNMGARGLSAKPGLVGRSSGGTQGMTPPEALPMWDFRSADSAGGSVSDISGESTGVGPGAGGSSGGAGVGSGRSVLGGGSGCRQGSDDTARGGNGSGGQGGANTGGPGGNGYIQIFWDHD